MSQTGLFGEATAGRPVRGYLPGRLVAVEQPSSPPTQPGLIGRSARDGRCHARAIGLRLAGTPWAEVPTALGLRRPATRAIALSGLVGALFLVVLVLCASMLGVDP